MALTQQLDVHCIKGWPNTCNIVKHCCRQLVAHVWPPCCNMLDQVWKCSNFLCNNFGCHMMLYAFGPVLATLLHWSMRTSSICYFKAPSNKLQHIATGWPNMCHMLYTMLHYVVLKCCVQLARPLNAFTYCYLVSCISRIYFFPANNARNFQTFTVNSLDFCM